MCFTKATDGYLFQQIATRIGDLLCLNFGLLFGLSSSQILLYQSAETPLNERIDEEAASLFSAYLCLGAVFGSVAFGYASHKIGPRSTLLLCGLLQTGSWFCILFGYSIDHIYSSRVVGGLAVGGAFTVLPIYIRDICEEIHQHSLLSTIEPANNLGIALGFLIGSHIPYDYLPFIGIVISFIFTMCFPFMPESPHYFKRRSDPAMMEKSLRWFRGIRRFEDRCKPDFIEEVKRFGETKKVDEFVSKRSKLRLFFTTTVVVFTSQLCGIYVIINYGELIFRSVSAPVSSTWCCVILACGLWGGSVVGSIVHPRINKKVLFCVTSLLSGLLLMALASILTFEDLFTRNVGKMEWVPLVILTGHMTIASIGFYSLTNDFISEMSPPKIRLVVAVLAMTFMWSFASIALKFFYVAIQLIEFSGLLWIFGSVCLLEFLFAIFFLPTKCKEPTSEVSS